MWTPGDAPFPPLQGCYSPVLMATNQKRSDPRDNASSLFDDLPFDLPEAPARKAVAKPRAAGKENAGDSTHERDPDPPPMRARLPLAAPAPPPLPPRHDPAHDPVPEGPPPKLSISERAMRAAGGPANPPYLEGLNPEQRAAVEALDGPVLVLAGAGTGKTRVLTTRIAHILATGRAWPSQVLAVTFTNKAAREMKDRIGHLVGGAVEGMPWLGTFHSIGVKILRRHAELVGLKHGFTILDTDDQIRLIKQIIQAAKGMDDKDRWTARQARLCRDTGWLEKPRLLTPDKDIPEGEAQGFCQRQGRRKLYEEYQEPPQVDPERRPISVTCFCMVITPVQDPAGCPQASYQKPLPLSCWWTNIRTPTSRSTCGCGCWPRATPNVCCVGR